MFFGLDDELSKKQTDVLSAQKQELLNDGRGNGLFGQPVIYR